MEEFIGAKQLIDPLAVGTAAGDLVGGVGVANILYGASQHFQTTIDHFTLYKSCTAIIIAVKDNVRRGNILHIGNGRFSLQHAARGFLPGIAAEIIGDQSPRISFSEKSSQIVNATLRAGGGEALIVCEDPGHQVPGIGAAGYE